MVSSFSLIMTVLVFNLFMLAMAAGMRHTRLLVRHGSFSLFILAVLSVVRLCMPLDLQGAWIVRSYAAVPRILAFLDTRIFRNWTVAMVLVLVWALGSLFMLARTCLGLARAFRRRRRYRAAPNTQALDVLSQLGQRASVMVSPDVGVPHMIGVTKAHIYLPQTRYTDAELAWVLRHELQHFKSRDTLTKLFYLLLTVVFWWNPIVHWFQTKLDNLLELKCDMQLVGKLSQLERIAYLEVMLKTLAAGRGPAPANSQAVSAFIKDSPDFLLRQRFEIILNAPQKRKPLHQTLAICVIIAVFLASFFVIIQPAYPAPAADEGMSVLRITPENAYIVCKDGVYSVYVDGALWGAATVEVIESSFSFLEIIYETE